MQRVLVVTATEPTKAEAYQAIIISGQFSAWMSTLSPLTTPRAISPHAT